MFFLSLAAFFLVFALPLLPGLLELMHPSDAGAMHVREAWLRDPRFFGLSFRAKLVPFLAAMESQLPYRGPFLERAGEIARGDSIFDIAANAREREILIARDTVRCGKGARVLDLYAGKMIELGDDVIARTLVCDGPITVGTGCRITHWIDAGGDISCGGDTRLGAVSTLARLQIARHSRFVRAFALPVLTANEESSEAAPPHKGPRDAHALKDFAVRSDNLIIRGALQIGRACRIEGSIKTSGPLSIGDDTVVLGNVIGRRDISIGNNVQIVGHVFAEGAVHIGNGVRVGNAWHSRTVFSAGTLSLGSGVSIFGAIVADRGARVR